MILQTIALTFVVLLLVVIGMAIGVIFAGRRITGSCGGLAAAAGMDRCGVCGRDMRDSSQSDCVKRDSKIRA